MSNIWLLQSTPGCISCYMHVSDVLGIFSASPLNRLGHILSRERDWLLKSRSKWWINNM